MVDEIQEQIEAHRVARDRAAYQYAKFDDKKYQAEFEKNDYIVTLLISLLPK